MAEKETPAEKLGIRNPHLSEDPNIDDERYRHLDPTKVIGTWAEQPDPNADRGAPLPNIPEGVKKAPADDAEPKSDAPGAGHIGTGKNN